MRLPVKAIPKAFFAAVALSAAIGVTAELYARQRPAPETAAAIERGRKQFAESCGFCHGADATGARGPDLVRSPLVAHDVKGDKIGEVIRHGRPDKGMPPQNLSDEQIAGISAFLHARIVEAIESSGVPSVYSVQRMLTGNADAGKAFFNGPGHCKDCHSPTGDLAGIARKYSPIELESRMLFPEGPPPNGTVTLANGEQVQGRVKHLDDFVVIVKDASGAFRSFARDQVRFELQDPLAAHRQLLNQITPTNFHDLFAYMASLK